MRKTLAFTILSILALTAHAMENWQNYKPTGYMSDYAGIFSARENEAINGLLSQLGSQYGVVVMGVSVPNLDGVAIDELAKYFYDTWRVGLATDNRAALVLVSKADSQLHIYTGLGLRGVLNSQWSDKLAAKLDKLMDKGKLGAATVGIFSSVAQRVHDRAGDLPRQKFSSTKNTNASGAVVGSLRSGQVGGLPLAAVAAAGFGGFLLISTLVRAQASQKSVYEWGRDFERGRTGAFGNKKPRWL